MFRSIKRMLIIKKNDKIIFMHVILKNSMLRFKKLHSTYKLLFCSLCNIAKNNEKKITYVVFFQLETENRLICPFVLYKKLNQFKLTQS